MPLAGMQNCETLQSCLEFLLDVNQVRCARPSTTALYIQKIHSTEEVKKQKQQTLYYKGSKNENTQQHNSRTS